MEPCVELRLDADGITVQIEARVAPGQINMTPDEAGRWLAWVMADVNQIQLQRTVTGDTSPQRLVKSGWRAWERPEQMPPLLSREEIAAMQEPVPTMPQEAAEPPAAAPPAEEPQTVLHLAEPDEGPAGEASGDPTPEEIAQALQAPPPPAVEPARGRVEQTSRTKQGKAVLAVLKKSKEPLDISTVRDRSKLTDYMTRKVLTALRDEGAVQEQVTGSGGRWGGKAVYTSSK